MLTTPSAFAHASLRGTAMAAASSGVVRMALARRCLSSHSPTMRMSQAMMDAFAESSRPTSVGTNGGYVWPVRKTNTILNVCPQGEAMVVERLGKLFHIQQGGGMFLAVPFVDVIKFRIPLREQALRIEPLHAITSDNVTVAVAGNLYFEFVDPLRAAYGSTHPVYAAVMQAQASMRNCIGEMELDELLKGRQKMNARIVGSIEHPAQEWGMRIKRYEVTEITPESVVRTSMDKQAAAERSRREQVLHAEGEKQAAQLKSEGVKIQLQNESEGNLIRAVNEAEAEKRAMVLRAEGAALAVEKEARASAAAIEILAEAMSKPNGEAAAVMQVSEKLIAMQGEMGKGNATYFYSDKPADVVGLMAQAKAMLLATGGGK